MSNPICATNVHDRGMDLVEGSEVTGTVIGRVSYDDNEVDPGYVLRVADVESYPYTLDEVLEELAVHGYELDTVSISEVDGLGKA